MGTVGTTFVKLVVYVPEEHGDAVRAALGNAGAGKIGNYSHCSFSTKGVGRFVPQKGSTPFIGSGGKLEVVCEERIETVCPRAILTEVVAAMKAVHPYEEVAYDVYSLEEIAVE